MRSRKWRKFKLRSSFLNHDDAFNVVRVCDQSCLSSNLGFGWYPILCDIIMATRSIWPIYTTVWTCLFYGIIGRISVCPLPITYGLHLSWQLETYLPMCFYITHQPFLCIDLEAYGCKLRCQWWWWCNEVGSRRRNRNGGANGANDQVGVELEEVSSLLVQELAIASPCMSFGDGTQAKRLWLTDI